MKYKNLKFALIIAALAVAAFFIFFRLTLADPLTDEAELAFRSVGLMDFLATPYQTTPYEWFARTPWWAGLSFHDHPPLVFLTEHLFFKSFGDGLFVLRLPFAIAGLLSLIFIYLLTRELFGEKTAVSALLLGAVNTYLVWISRIGLQEIFVIFFCLFCLWTLLKARTNTQYLIAWGVGLGLAGLTKYTALFIILPLSVIFTFVYHVKLLKNKYFYYGLGIFVILFSPVVIYNLAMYASVNHFDLQLATLLRQKTPEWPFLLGKQIGSLSDRIKNFFPNLFQNSSPAFFLSFATSLLWFLIRLIRQKRQKIKISASEVFLFWTIIIISLLIVLVGPSQRFLAMLVPFSVILMSYMFVQLLNIFENRHFQKIIYVIFAVFLIYEGVYDFRTNHALAVSGSPPWSFSLLRFESSSWGYNELENYLKETFDKNRPAVKLALPSRLQFVEKFRVADYRGIKINPEKAALVIYDPRLNNVAKLWLYDRRYYYDGWPFISTDEYSLVKEGMPDYFGKLGIKEYYYIAADDGLFTAGNTTPSQKAEEFNKQLSKSQPLKQLYNNMGQKTFSVYYSPGDF